MHNTFNFRPVGQGGFTTGTIKENNKPVFNWVYDCGTKSSGSFLKNQITAAKTELYNNTIDLLILSHFDEDHVNGVVELLQNIRCRVLVIPFMTIFERLAIFSKGGAKAEWHRRLLENPQSFFLEGDFEIGRVIMVDGNDELPNDITTATTPLNPDEIQSNAPEGPTRNIGDNLNFNDRFVYMRVPFALEEKTLGFTFKFYIKKFPDAAINAFRDAVGASIDYVDAGELFEDKNQLILKGLYKDIFGDMNKISLCVSVRKKKRVWVHYDDDPNGYFGYEPRIVGLLLTGDSFLKTRAARREFQNYYADDIGDTIIFQIPHHGSKENSKLDRANLLWNFRVFAMQYGHGRKKHPSETLNQFVIDHGFHVRRITQFTGFVLSFEIY